MPASLGYELVFLLLELKHIKQYGSQSAVVYSIFV
jgi:hypothetical protein